MELYKYDDGVKISKYPLLCLYIERMNESWQAKLFGIVLPLYAITCLTLIIINPQEVIYLTIQVITSVLFLFSYLLLVIKNGKDLEKKISDLENKFTGLK